MLLAQDKESDSFSFWLFTFPPYEIESKLEVVRTLFHLLLYCQRGDQHLLWSKEGFNIVHE